MGYLVWVPGCVGAGGGVGLSVCAGCVWSVGGVRWCVSVEAECVATYEGLTRMGGWVPVGTVHFAGRVNPTFSQDISKR